MALIKSRAVSQSVLCAGIVVADLCVPVLPRLPDPGELLATGDFLLATGGCAANTAICLAKQGASSRVAGMVGADSFGDFIEQDLRAKGVDASGLGRSSAHGTSQTVILPVMGCDRRYIHTIGANADLTAGDIDSALGEVPVLYLGGFFVLPGLIVSDLAELLRSARRRGVRTVLDVVIPIGAGEHSLADLEEVLPFVDVFMPNDQEAYALTGELEPYRQAAALRAAGCGTAVITLGSRGALLMSADETLEVPGASVVVVDPSGAGDAFAAGFIVGMLEGWTTSETLAFACVVGASACTRLGTHAGVWTRQAAEDYCTTHPLALQRLAPPPQSAGDTSSC